MKPLPFLLVCAAAVTCGGGNVRAVLLSNGNLDRTHAVEIVPGFFLPQPDNWVNQASRSISGPYLDDLSSEPWAGPAPTPVTTDGDLNAPFPSGHGGPDGGVFFKAFSGGGANGSATAHLYQDNFANPGWTYTLTGWAGAEPNYLASETFFALDFLNSGGGVISSLELDLSSGLFVPNGQPFNYKQYSLSATAPANSVSVRSRISMIGGIANPAGGGQAFVVDDFELNAVPEPSGALLGLTALAGLLGVRSRKLESR